MLPTLLIQDPLTSVGARVAFDKHLSAAVDHAARFDLHFAVIVLDIDHFKSVNDAFGHQHGDAVLREFAQQLAQAVRPHDQVFRYGGDEFALLLPNTGLADARALGEQLLAKFRTTPCGNNPPLTLSISAGIACFPVDGATDTELVATADRRHYDAKRTGRARVVSYDHTIANSALEPPSRLIERDGLFVATQTLLGALGQQQVGILQIVGQAGAGRTRGLWAVRAMAEMLGYTSLTLQGTPALRRRLFGAMSRALCGIPGFDTHNLTPAYVAQRLYQWLEQQHTRGLIITLDDPEDMDDGTLELIQILCEDVQFQHLAVVVATDQTRILQHIERNWAVTTIYLTPISLEGIHTWLRQTLRWEPPAELIAWLHQQSEGLPARFWQLLQGLVAHNMLYHQSGSGAWQLAPGYQRYGANLTTQPQLPIPVGLPEFIGRANEIMQLLELVHTHRLVAITGQGGLGKTRLAMQVGAEAGEQLREGVVFVPLAGAATLARVIPLIAEALGMASSGDLSSTLVHALQRREILIVLDNVEHLIGIEHILRDLLDQTDLPRLLVTSRQRLAMPEAISYELGGLDLPHDASSPAIEQSGAGQFFLRRVQQLNPAYRLHAADRDALHQICRMLEGMPLGLELAASMVSTPLQDLADRLTADLGTLRAERPDLPERHRSISSVVAAFWERLSRGERAMLRRLALFRGGFDQPAARAIAQASPFFLSALVASGYVRQIPDGRYEMHELLRQHAEGRLRQAPRDARATRQRFAEHYARFVAHAHVALREGGAALAAFRRDSENILAAWHWAIQQNRMDVLAQLGPGLARYWEISGQLHIGAPLMDTAIDTVARWCHIHPHDQASSALYCHLLCRRAWINLIDEHIQDPELLQLVGLAQQAAYASEEGSAIAEYLLIQAASDLTRNPTYALECLAQAQTLEQSNEFSGDRLRLEGIAHTMLGDLERAEACYRAAFTYFESINDHLGRCRTLLNLAANQIDLELYREAFELLGTLRSIAHGIGSSELEIAAQITTGHLYMLVAYSPQAHQALDQAQAMIDSTGHISQITWEELSRAMLFLVDGDLERAERYCRQQLARYDLNDQHADWANLSIILGLILCEQAQPAEAEPLLQAALQALQGYANPGVITDIQAGLAWVALQNGDLAAAQALVEIIVERIPTGDMQRQYLPFLILQVCWRVLLAAQDPRACDMLNEARLRLAQRSTGLNDPLSAAHYRTKMLARWEILQVALEH